MIWTEVDDILPYGGAEENKLELRVIMTEIFRKALEELEIPHCSKSKVEGGREEERKEWGETVVEREREKCRLLEYGSIVLVLLLLRNGDEKEREFGQKEEGKMGIACLLGGGLLISTSLIHVVFFLWLAAANGEIMKEWCDILTPIFSQ